jgi:hypothetical protein
VAPVPDLSNVATPTKAIITIPIILYGYGNGDDAEEGVPEHPRMIGPAFSPLISTFLQRRSSSLRR